MPNLSAAQPDFFFTPTADLPAATAAHTATVLNNSNILVTGGYGKLFGRLPVASNLIRIYDHKKMTWRIAQGQLIYGRIGHSAIRLANGKVIIAGGIGQDKNPVAALELFDPASEQSTLIGKISSPCLQPCLNLLPGGDSVMITGNTRRPEIIKKTESGYTVRPTKGICSAKHTNHAAVTLNNGSIILLGGRTKMIERFDPRTELFSASKARLPQLIDDQAAILLFNGKILLAGGQEIYSNQCLAQTWLYDPLKDTLSLGPVLNATAQKKRQPGASDIMAVDLFAGDPRRQGRTILLCGGEYDPGRDNHTPDVTLDSAWIYNAQTRQLTNVGPMLHPHDDFAAAYLPAQSDYARALIIAGHGPNDSFQSNCEVFHWRVYP